VSDLNPQLLHLLEHLIVSHLNLPEWGSPHSTTGKSNHNTVYQIGLSGVTAEIILNDPSARGSGTGLETHVHPALKLLALPFTAGKAGIREKGPERRALVEAALRADPGDGKREIGRRLNLNHHQIGDMRRGLEVKGEIPRRPDRPLVRRAM
jgi:hypothetical protein